LDYYKFIYFAFLATLFFGDDFFALGVPAFFLGDAFFLSCAFFFAGLFFGEMDTFLGDDGTELDSVAVPMVTVAVDFFAGDLLDPFLAAVFFPAFAGLLGLTLATLDSWDELLMASDVSFLGERERDLWGDLDGVLAFLAPLFLADPFLAAGRFLAGDLLGDGAFTGLTAISGDENNCPPISSTFGETTPLPPLLALPFGELFLGLRFLAAVLRFAGDADFAFALFAGILCNQSIDEYVFKDKFVNLIKIS